MNEREVETVLRELVKRAIVSAEFRAKCLEDGPGAFALIAHKPLPSGMSIRFVANAGPFNRTYVLPDPIEEPEQLLAEDLEQVAGGVAKELCGSSCGSISCLNT
jgi:hypothetical protein